MFVHFNRFREFLKSERNYSEHTVRAYMTDLLQFSGFLREKVFNSACDDFEFLLREGVVNRNSAKLVPTPKGEKKLPAFLTVDEVFTLLDTEYADSAIGYRDKAILELLYSSGLRVSELVGISLSDINLTNSLVKVLGKEGKKELFRSDLKLLTLLTYIFPKEVNLNQEATFFL